MSLIEYIKNQIEEGKEKSLVQDYLKLYPGTTEDALAFLTNNQILEEIDQSTEERGGQILLLSDVHHHIYDMFVPDYREYETPEEEQEFLGMYNSAAGSTINLIKSHPGDIEKVHQEFVEITNYVEPEPELESESKNHSR